MNGRTTRWSAGAASSVPRRRCVSRSRIRAKVERRAAAGQQSVGVTSNGRFVNDTVLQAVNCVGYLSRLGQRRRDHHHQRRQPNQSCSVATMRAGQGSFPGFPCGGKALRPHPGRAVLQIAWLTAEFPRQPVQWSSDSAFGDCRKVPAPHPKSGVPDLGNIRTCARSQAPRRNLGPGGAWGA